MNETIRFEKVEILVEDGFKRPERGRKKPGLSSFNHNLTVQSYLKQDKFTVERNRVKSIEMLDRPLQSSFPGIVMSPQTEDDSWLD